MDDEPYERGDGNGDDVVLVEAHRRHGEERRHRGFSPGVAGQEPDERCDHHGVADQLRIVHADEARERARHHRDEPQPADGGPGEPAAEFRDHLGDQASEHDDRQERHRPPDIERIDACHLGERADDIEGQGRVVVDDQGVGRGVKRGRAHGRVGVIGVPAFVLRDFDGKAGAPYRPHHEVDGKQREQPDLRPGVEAPQQRRHRPPPPT